MALEWLGKWFGDSDSMAQSLAHIASSRMAVRVEIEKTLIRFDSHMALPQGGKVILEKPERINGELTSGSFVRLVLPGERKAYLRLEVMIPHYNLTNGRAAFICKFPEEQRTCRRCSERHPASHYTNLVLQIQIGKFKLLDLSASGLKYQATSTWPAAYFPIGKDLGPACLVVTQGSQVNLARLVPRNHYGGGVGCEIKVAADAASQARFKQILASIQTAESARLRG